MPTESAQVGRVQRVRDWEPVRKAFLEAPERPSLQELADQFGIPAGSVNKACFDEGWMVLRARRLELIAKESDALGRLVKAVQGENAILDRVRTVSLLLLESMAKDLEDLTAEPEINPTTGKAAKTLAASTVVNLHQTVSFTLKNLCDALRSVGLVGLKRMLDDGPGGQGSPGDWKGAIRDLNVMLKVDVAGSGPAKVTEIVATPKV